MSDPQILHRDEHFVALDKPAGLASVRERWTDDDSALVVVWNLLREAEEAAPKPRVVHRLDKETTGVLLFATSREAARSISRQFKEREVRKRYLAIVKGTPPEESGTIEVNIAEDRGRPGCVRVVEKRGKVAITDWSRGRAFRGYSLLEVRPRTGRTHQIRVSLRHAGYPLLVDPAYGGDEALFLSRLKPGYKSKKDFPERPVLARVSLHAERLAFDHPITGEAVEVVSELPKDMSLALKYLEKYRALAG